MKNQNLALAIRVCVLLLGLLFLPGVSAKPVAQQGLLDLSDWDFSRNGAIELNGEWRFYWNRHLSSDLIRLEQLQAGQARFLEVPGNWNESGEYSNLGFATYRLEVLISDLRPLALKMRTVGTAYRLYVDGVELVEVGTLGQSAVTTTPAYRPDIFSFTPQSRRVEIILLVANYHHRNAGVWEAIVLGDQTELEEMRQGRFATDFILFGAIVMMALYNLITWITRRENVSGLWLGLFCLTLSTRILLVDERFINEVLPDLPWSLLTRFEYVSWFLSIPIFLAFIRSMFPTETSLLVLRALWALGVIFTLLTIVLPIIQATSLVPPFQVLTLLSMGYGAYCIGLAIWRRKEGSILFGCGAVFLFVSAVSDIITVMFTLDGDNQLQFGLYLFVLLQSILVSVRSSRAFQTVEAQSSELRKTNLELHIQEKLRRTAEGQSQALHEQVSQSMRTFGFGVVAQAVAERLQNEPEDHGELARQTLVDLSLLLRGELPERKELELQPLVAEFFQSAAFRSLKADYPLVDVSTNFELSDVLFKGSYGHLETLLFHLARYSLRTQIHAQQIRISGRTDYVYAGSLFHHQVSDGHYYIVAVEDQGQGIRPEDLVEIFDPEQKSRGYVDLKPGPWDLAVAWTILEDHGGAIDLHSLAETTRLELYFPIAKQGT